MFANQHGQGQADAIGNMALSDIQRFSNMGRACRICDRKFFLHASYQSYAALLTHYVDDIAEVEQNFNILKIELSELEQQTAHVDEQIREEEKRYITADVNQRLKLEKLQVEHEEMRQ